MPLKSELTRLKSPIRRFCEDRLPNLSGMQRQWHAAGDVTVPPRVKGSPISGRVGAAFDYRLRYYFAVTPPDKLKARAAGVPSYLVVEDVLSKLVPALAPVGRVLNIADEYTLCRWCYVLALYEEIAQVGPRAATNSPVIELQREFEHDRVFPRGDEVERWLLESVPDEPLRDLVALSWAFARTQSDLFGTPTVCNPSFVGSSDVGGVDADLLLGSCLIKINTTADMSLDRASAYQLLCSALVDYEDRHNITEVGFYLARRPALMRWPLADLLNETAAGRSVDVTSLRRDLKDALRGHSLRRPAWAARSA